ncbi:c-type cytochrome [Candidatus Methylospira mobilis]|uniref:C-type cytochrome n=1 Tax=Candidatus Methylospira mobilis TaxID=1808979 RepID=A0A5Q0BNW1_9GAMM|nr:c-type cytochrome [Candidatus Methylospira mobilis]QFY43436.1 c-type cytochrome [Candidatus Methylospira mobilis]WNV03325.1 c-type cytochrome [Candidatus Methylospira mobilis]
MACNSPTRKKTGIRRAHHQVTALLCVAGFLASCAPPTAQQKNSSAPLASGYRPDIRHGAKIYTAYCSACHDKGTNGAPQLDDAEEWDERADAWPADIDRHVKSGFLSMPARGGRSELSDADISDTIYYILSQVEANDD